MYEKVQALEKICEEENIVEMEALLGGLIPDDWLPDLLPRVWTETSYPALYAGTDTYVCLFKRAGCTGGAGKAQHPTVIYRGTATSKRREGRGMSWTRKPDRAREHARRSGEQHSGRNDIEPTIWCAEIPPEGILAEIDYEVIVNPRRLRKLRIVEQLEGTRAPEKFSLPTPSPTSDNSRL